MNIWRGLDQIPEELTQSVVTIGVFDGVHRGHQALINRALETARRLDAPCVMCTFDPHPREVFAPGSDLKLLASTTDRLAAVAELGVDAALVVDFRRELAGLSPREYFADVVVGMLHARAVVVGENFTFGANAAGTAETMRALGEEYGVAVEIVPLVRDEGQVLCSSLVREYLASSDVRRAAWVLGAPLAVTGLIEHGAGRGGRDLGYPTANQYFPTTRALPADGVYAGWLTVVDENPIEGSMEPGVRYPAAISVGTNPTFGDSRRAVESFVLDENADLYDRVARVEFVDWVRDMEKFHSVEELLIAMERDVARVREILGREETLASS